jgi:hypothetical protein
MARGIRLDHAEIIRLKRSNPRMQHSEVARRVGGSTRQVQRILVDALGREKEPAVPIVGEEEEFILYLLRDGCPYSEVARTVGRTATTLARKYPGYGMGNDGRLVGHMFNDFERLLERLGLDDANPACR